MHNNKKESKLTNANRGEIFKSDVDVELDNNKHVDDTLNLRFLLLKN